MNGIPHKIEIISRGLAMREGAVLLCNNLKHGHFYLPGGHVEPGEAAAAACVREYREETGLTIVVGSLLLVAELRFTQDGTPRHELNFVFHVEQDAGAPIPAKVESQEKKLSFLWMRRADLVQPSCKPQAIMRWIQRADVTAGGIDWISDAE